MGADINNASFDDSSEVAGAIQNTNTKLAELAAIKTELTAIKSSLSTLAGKSFSGGGNTIKAIYHLDPYTNGASSNFVNIPSGVNLNKSHIKCIGTVYTAAGREGVAAATGEVPFRINGNQIINVGSSTSFSVEITEYN